jgi:type VI secretion system secreted protein Hcp
MATDNFMVLVQQDGKLCLSESTTVVDFADPFPGRPKIGRVAQAVFEITEFSFQVGLTAATQSTAGKITFAPLHITRNPDSVSPILFDMCASGTKFQHVDLLHVRYGGGTSGSPNIYSGYGLDTVTIQSISYSSGGEVPQETVILEYEVLSVGYAKQDPAGKVGPFVIKTWNQVKNARA